MTSIFNAVAAPFKAAWQLFHQVCMPFMFIMLLADPTGFLTHMVHAATLTPDAISNVAGVFGAKASAATTATTLTHAHGAAAAITPIPSGIENFCPPAGGAFEDYKQVFDCGTADYKQSIIEMSQKTRTPLEDAVASMCSSGTVVTNKVWDYTPIG